MVSITVLSSYGICIGDSRNPNERRGTQRVIRVRISSSRCGDRAVTTRSWITGSLFPGLGKLAL